MRRKQFLTNLTGSTAAMLFINNSASAQAQVQASAKAQVQASAKAQAQAQGQPQPQEPAPLPLDLVKEFVIAGHGDFPKVQAMVKDHPNLIYCKFDWGNGDYEAAIEGAGHVGNKDIANFLLQSGSRITLYILTMLGRTDLVRPVLEAYPQLITAKGPHGFTLLHHAKMGGKDGEELYAWLQEKGLKEDWIKLR